MTLRAKDVSRDTKHSINLVADELARQVKRHRDKRRGGASRAPARREAAAARGRRRSPRSAAAAF